MAVKPKGKQKNGAIALKNALKTGEFDRLYLITGEESYLKEHYLEELKKKVVDETFRDFNLVELDGKYMTPEALSDAIESYPVMAERKLVVVTDFDIYKAPAPFQPVIETITEDLPDYICLVIYYDILEFKPDKRTKVYQKLDKIACVAEFSRMEERELIAWLRRGFRGLGKTIDDGTCSYMLFLCGNSMTNLVGEMEKVAAFATVEAITQYHIDAVCTRVLDAVVFDLTDAISARKFDQAVALVNDLIAQKNNEVAIFTAITRHIQRLYAAKLNAEAHGGESDLFELLGTRSSYYARQIVSASRKTTLPWLRRAAQICGETDIQLKSSAADKQKLLELALLSMAGGET